MDQTSYQSPQEHKGSRSGRLLRFLRLPSTVIEWVVIVVVALVTGALLLPDVDDGVESARRRAGPQRAAQPER